MDYQLYVEKAHKANELKEAGDTLGAITLFEELVNSDISDLDKANMCYNIAICCEKLDYDDRALAWYDEGIQYETPHKRTFVTESKAVHFGNRYANRERDAEAIAIYEHLYSLPQLLEQDKERIWKNLTVLRNPRPK